MSQKRTREEYEQWAATPAVRRRYNHPDQLLQDTRDDPGMPVVLLDIDRCAFMGEDSNDLLRTCYAALGLVDGLHKRTMMRVLTRIAELLANPNLSSLVVYGFSMG